MTRMMNTIHSSPFSRPKPGLDARKDRLCILVACDSHAWGGLEREVVWLADTWQERGHRVMLFVPHGSRIESQAREHGLDVLPHSRRGLRRGMDLFRLARWIRAQSPDVIHIHNSQSLRMLWLARPLAQSRAPLYLTRHMGLKHSRKDILNRMLYRRIKRIYAISEYVAQGIREHIPIPRDRVRILPPGIRYQHFAKHPIERREARALLGLDPDRSVVGMLGRITPMKGHREFLLALNALTGQGQPIQGLVAGAADAGPIEQSYLREIRVLQHALGLDTVVHFTGDCPDPRIAFAAMDIFVFPSHLESFGMTVVEAMTYGLPVIASDAGGIPGIIEHGRTGLLVPPADPHALAQAITRLLADPDLRNRLAQAAQSATRIFDIHEIARRYESDFQEDLREAAL